MSANMVVKRENRDSQRAAASWRIGGRVQGVGFRPFVYRLAHDQGLTGWVRNCGGEVEIHAEGPAERLRLFGDALLSHAPPAAGPRLLELRAAALEGSAQFEILPSAAAEKLKVHVPLDLFTCDECVGELADRAARRYRYPFINCTQCGPRYTLIRAMPYDRPNTTMQPWPLDEYCAAEYEDPGNRRFHAQPVACANCGPHYYLHSAGDVPESEASIRRAAHLLGQGSILAIKGLGGYHLACDARNGAAVAALRERKYRKEKPFALMAKDIAVVRGLVELSQAAESLLTSPARPITAATVLSISE